jgi:hypothetical protein
MMIVIFLHVGPFAAHVVAELETQIAAIARGERPETMRRGRSRPSTVLFCIKFRGDFPPFVLFASERNTSAGGVNIRPGFPHSG